MEYSIVKREFKIVGFKGRGFFANFSREVPLLAKEILNRSNEIQSRTDTEIALYEAKRDIEHQIGDYYVGLIVNEKLNEVPLGMNYLETNQYYVTTKGIISNIGNLHMNLLKWAEEQAYERDLESYIVETYHPNDNREEEVQIYLPIL